MEPSRDVEDGERDCDRPTWGTAIASAALEDLEEDGALFLPLPLPRPRADVVVFLGAMFTA